MVFITNSMPYSDDYLQYVLEQLAGLRGAVSRRMFGGAGLYHDELFFGLIASDTLYFRVDDDNRPDYEALGMARFRPYKDKPILSLNYYEVPVHVLENADELVVWARRSLQAAAAAGQKVARRPKKKARRHGGRRKPTA
jgi:DNA transformation protein and related proteins